MWLNGVVLCGSGRPVAKQFFLALAAAASTGKDRWPGGFLATGRTVLLSGACQSS